MGLRANIRAVAGKKRKEKQCKVTETYKLFKISASALKISNQALMESVSDVIKKTSKVLFCYCLCSMAEKMARAGNPLRPISRP